MAKKRYPIPITELREVTVGWRHTCEVCGTEFESKRKDARFCSLNCRHQSFREKRREQGEGAVR